MTQTTEVIRVAVDTVAELPDVVRDGRRSVGVVVPGYPTNLLDGSPLRPRRVEDRQNPDLILDNLGKLVGPLLQLVLGQALVGLEVERGDQITRSRLGDLQKALSFTSCVTSFRPGEVVGTERQRHSASGESTSVVVLVSVPVAFRGLVVQELQ